MTARMSWLASSQSRTLAEAFRGRKTKKAASVSRSVNLPSLATVTPYRLETAESITWAAATTTGIWAAWTRTSTSCSQLMKSGMPTSLSKRRLRSSLIRCSLDIMITMELLRGRLVTTMDSRKTSCLKIGPSTINSFKIKIGFLRKIWTWWAIVALQVSMDVWC